MPVIQEEYVKYNYETPWLYYPLRIDKYMGEYMNCISEAQNAIYDAINMKYLERTLLLYTGSPLSYADNKLRQEQASVCMEKIEFLKWAYGILVDIKDICNVSQSLIDYLNNMKQQLKAWPTVTNALNNAKNWITRGIREPVYKSEDFQWRYNYYYLNTPLLVQIRAGNELLRFDYALSRDSVFYLSEVAWCNQFTLQKKIKIQRNADGSLLKQLTWQDDSARVYEYLKFDYYYENTVSRNRDYWGYYASENILGTTAFCKPISAEYCRKYSLKQVKNHLGGIINFDYEPNKCDRLLNPELGNIHQLFGGIRLKQIVYADDGIRSDTVFYRYPQAGKMVYDTLKYEERVTHTYSDGRIGAADIIKRSSVNCEGHVYVNAGNNGLFYPYVQEVFPGKGMNAYLFSVAPPSGDNKDYMYPWWLSGVLLGKAVYDNNNNLLEVNRNCYYTTLAGVASFDDRQFFTESDEIPSYNKYYGQVKAYPFYSTVNIPWFNKKVRVYIDGSDSFYVDPYEGLYCRAGTIVPESFHQLYNIYFGGKTLLKEQRKFQYNAQHIDNPGPEDIRRAEQIGGILSNHLEYAYNNAWNNSIPTRLTLTDSKGDKLITTRYTLSELSDKAFPYAKEMRARNMFSSVLKEQTLLQKSGSSDYLLLDEKVNEFESFPTSDTSAVYLPVKEYRLINDMNRSISQLPYFPQNTLYSYPFSSYSLVNKSSYDLFKNNYLMVENSDRTNMICNIWDSYGQKLLLKAEGSDYFSVDARNVDLQYLLRAYSYIFNFTDLFIDLKKHPFFIDYQGLGLYDPIHNFCRMIVASPLLISFRQSIMKQYYCPNFVELVEYAFKEGVEFTELSESEFKNVKNALFYFANADEGQLAEISEFIFAQLINGKHSYLPDFLPSFDEPVELRAKNTTKSYRAYLLMRPDTTSLRMEYFKENEYPVNMQNIDLAIEAGKYQLHIIDVGKSNTSMTLKIPHSANLVTGVLVPTDVSFEAYGYTSEGILFCRFDQTGIIEFYDYDSSGRLISVSDKVGNRLVTHEYKLLNP